VHPPLLDRIQRQALFEKCLKDVVGDGYPLGWFLGTDVNRDDVMDWIYWAVFSCDRVEAAPEWQTEAEEYLVLVERRFGLEFKDGNNGPRKTKSMRLTLDPVVMIHRPLLWYAIVGCVDTYTWFVLRNNGFKHYASGQWRSLFPPRPLTVISQRSLSPNVSYWYRAHRTTDKPPIVFIHGIGIGLYAYTGLLRRIAEADEEVGILAIELLAISMRMTRPVMGPAETCIAFSEILTSLGIDRFVLVGHSYGTVVGTYLLHSPELGPRIEGMLLIDPIPLLLHMPNVAYNFVYRQPRSANEWQLWYFTSRDADIARSLSRHFFWTESVLWKEELEGRPTVVVLSGDDQIVDAEAVWQYLTGEEEVSSDVWERDTLKVLFYAGLDHATVFDSRDRVDQLVGVLEGLNHVSNDHVV